MKQSITDRLMSKIAWPSALTACWPWRAFRDRDGYGQFHGGGGTAFAHRTAYELAIGPIPDGLQIDHLCRNRECVNPLHLEAVANVVNVLRGESPQARNARKARCNQGHAFTPENTYMYRNKRCCRACNRAAVARHKRRIQEDGAS